MLQTNHVLCYIGVTNNLSSRSHEHKSGEGPIFARKYHCTDIIYYECFEDIEMAIEREKQLKRWKRAWKEVIIKSFNPGMEDLYNEVEEME